MNLARPSISTLQTRRGISVLERQVATTALRLSKPSCRKAWRRFGRLPRMSRASIFASRDTSREPQLQRRAMPRVASTCHQKKNRKGPARSTKQCKLMRQLGEALQLLGASTMHFTRQNG